MRWAQDVIEALDDGLLVIDRAGSIVGWNTAMVRFTGRMVAGAVGRRATEVAPFVDQPELRAALDRAIALGEASTTEVRIETERDGPRSVEARCVPWREAEERGAAVFLSDLTARRREPHYTDAVRRAARLADLIAVTQSISSSLDTGDVIERITRAAAALAPGSLASVHLYDRERDVLASLSVSGTEWRGLPPDLRPGQGLPGLVFEAQVPVLVEHPARHPRVFAPDWWRARPGACYYGVPIIAGESFVGVLDYIVTDRMPSMEEQEALAFLAAHAGVAIRNASLYAGERVRAERIHALAEVNSRISAALELDELLRTILDAAVRLTGVRFASFWVADDHTRMLTLRLGSEPTIAADSDVARRQVRYGEGAVGWIAGHRRPLVLDDVFADDRTLDPSWCQRWDLRAFAGYPVTVAGELLAILVLLHSEPIHFAPETRSMLELFIAQAGVAIQNARLYREAKRRRDVAEALTGLGRELTATLDVQQIAEIVAGGTARLLDVRGAVVYRLEREDRTLHPVSASGPDAELLRGLVLGPGEGLAGLAITERRTVVTPDLLADQRIKLPPELRARISAYPWRSAAVVLLLAREHVLGVLAVVDEAGREFSPEELQTLQSFADQASLALENARLYAESERERREAAALADAARRLAMTLDLDQLAPQLVNALLDLFGAHASALYRLREDGEVVAVAYGGGARAHMRAGEVFPRSVGLIGRTITERRPVWSHDVLNEPALHFPPEFRAAVVASGNRAVLGVPLSVQNAVIGALAISHRAPHRFGAHEIALLQAFADQAALALENARLYASARDSLGRLRDTQAQLVQAAKMSALGQLVSGVAHELNNPLSVVIGYGQLLLTREVPAALRRPIELMVAQGDRMAKIVRNLLFFARQRPPERTPVDVNQVIEDTLALRQNQLALSSVTVEKDFAADLPRIPADTQQLQQVFLNLVLNAEQAIGEARRGGRIVLTTRLAQNGSAVRAEVVDDGPGIEAEALPRVFEPFFTTKQVGTGTGLGLSVSYGIVQEHGGRLTVESRPGSTVFAVELPVAAVVPAVAREPAAAPPPIVVGEHAALVIEDEPSVLDLVVTLLEEMRWRVDVATGGASGLERLAARRYDLVVSDIRMPGIGGEELFRRATAKEPALRQRFIFMTGDTANPDVWRFLKDTTVPVLEKPFTPAAFLDAVRRVMLSLTPSTSRA